MDGLVVLFLILSLGYILGSVNFCGIKLGTSGVLLVALVFGHYGFEMSSAVRSIGLASFVASVGVIAGPVFFRNFKAKAVAYISIGAAAVIIGAGLCVCAVKLLGIPKALAIGLMNGALTSTPGLAAAIEATGDPAASIGYGIAYPFGVVGVVLFIQIVPKLLHHSFADGAKELGRSPDTPEPAVIKKYREIDSLGFFPFSLAIIMGILIGRFVIPLPGDAHFSLGLSGGPLFAGLIIGHFGHIGPFSLRVKKSTLEVMRELGLSFFLASAGVSAGRGFLMTFAEHGAILFVAGALMTLMPMLICYFIARRLFGLDLLNTLGSICGGMTSTPALGVLISTTGSDYVSTSYAATYPVALILIVLASQFIAIFC